VVHGDDFDPSDVNWKCTSVKRRSYPQTTWINLGVSDIYIGESVLQATAKFKVYSLDVFRGNSSRLNVPTKFQKGLRPDKYHTQLFLYL
jgi:hypothetical protein